MKGPVRTPGTAERKLTAKGSGRGRQELTLEGWRRHLVATGSGAYTAAQRVGTVRRIASHAGVSPAALTLSDVRRYLDERQLSASTRETYLGATRAWCAYLDGPPAPESRRPAQRAPRQLLEHEPCLLEWAKHLRAQDYSERTVRHRVRVLSCFARGRGVSARELTQDDVFAYLSQGGYAPRTRENYLASLRLFCQWAGMEDITAEVRRVPIPRRVPKPVSEVGLASMLQVAVREHPEYALVVLGAYIGTRSAETAAVRAGDLEESGQGWALRIVGKAGVERLVPAPPVVVAALEPWIAQVKPGARLWPQATPTSVQFMVRRLAGRAGVRCTSHQLRHRYGTALYRACKDLLLVQRLMGHSSPATTAGYALVALEDAAAVVIRLPGAEAPSELLPTAVVELPTMVGA